MDSSVKKEYRNNEINFSSTTTLAKNVAYQSNTSVSSEKDYNPFEHRQIEHPNSAFGSVLHLLKACLGTGILAMPSAFKNAGLVGGVIGTLISGILCTHTIHILVRVSQELCVEARKPLMSYAETCGAAFAYGPRPLRFLSEPVKKLVDFCMFLTYVSVLCVYVVFIGTTIKEVIDVYYPDYGFSIQAYCAATFLPLALLVQIRNLKYLVPITALANVLLLIVFGVTLYFVFDKLPADFTGRTIVASVETWPLFFSTVIFAMEGIGIVMPVENEMKRPEKFLGCPGVLNVSMIIVILLFILFGFCGYWTFGDDAKGSVTLNLPQEQWIAQVGKLLMAIVIFFSYALQCYVPMETVKRLMEGKSESKFYNIIQITIRVAIVLVSVIVAISFPNLELVISLVGAIFFSTLGLLIPAIVDTVHKWDRGLGKFHYYLWKNLLLCLIAIFVLVSGSYVSIRDMIEEFGVSNVSINSTNNFVLK